MPSPQAQQIIRSGEVYTVAEFRRLSGLGDYSFRQVRREGLKVIAIGRKRYIRGADWLAYIDKKAQEQ